MDKKDLQQFFNKIESDESDFFLRFCSALRAGSNSLHHTVVSQAITLDEGWIDTLEKALFSVENIVHNPRKFIIDEEILVDVERAKRITPKTVRGKFLSSFRRRKASMKRSMPLFLNS